MPARKRKPPNKPPTFTLRQVEEQKPCGDGYQAALDALKSLPVPGGLYVDNSSSAKKKRSRYGPDQEIPLTEVAPFLEDYQLEFLMCNLLPDGAREQIYDRADEIRDGAHRQAIQELYSPPTTKSTKGGKK